jgi:hypothetical protein
VSLPSAGMMYSLSTSSFIIEMFTLAFMEALNEIYKSPKAVTSLIFAATILI